MNKEKQMALQTAKEITVKFIEIGRISPSNFTEVFPTVYESVRKTMAMDPGAEMSIFEKPEPEDNQG